MITKPGNIFTGILPRAIKNRGDICAGIFFVSYSEIPIYLPPHMHYYVAMAIKYADLLPPDEYLRLGCCGEYRYVMCCPECGHAMCVVCTDGCEGCGEEIVY